MRAARSLTQQVVTLLRGGPGGCDVGVASLVATTSQSTYDITRLWPPAHHNPLNQAPPPTIHTRHFAAKPGKRPPPRSSIPAASIDSGHPQSRAVAARQEADALLKGRRKEFSHFPATSFNDREAQQSSPPPATSSAKLRSTMAHLSHYSVDDMATQLHRTFSDMDGRDVQLSMFEFGSPYQSAVVAAGLVADALECGFGWGKVTQFFIKTVGAEPDVAGIKIQVKGRLSGKAGMAAKKIWEHGSVSDTTFSECVDYAEDAALTRAGFIGVKVWIRYKPGSTTTSVRGRPASTAPIPLKELLSLPRTPIAQPPTAWWNIPGPLQPAYCDAGNSWRPAPAAAAAAAEAVTLPASPAAAAGVAEGAEA